MKKEWKKNSSEKVYETQWFDITKDELVTPSGKSMTYYVLHKPVGSVVLPFDGSRFHLVKVFRPSVWRHSWEFPMGTSGNKEASEVAQIELREETGFTAGSWTHIGSFIGAPGTSAQAGEAFLAQELKPGPTERDDGEADMEMAAFTSDEIDAMIASGEIFDGWTITPWYFYKQYLSKKK